jgi:hypothetical protein
MVTELVATTVIEQQAHYIPYFAARSRGGLEGAVERCFAAATSRRNFEGQNLLKCLLLSTPR